MIMLKIDVIKFEAQDIITASNAGTTQSTEPIEFEPNPDGADINQPQ